MKPPSEPWWSTPGVDNVYLSSGSFKAPEEVGITLLPQYLYAFDNQWWHCNHCGKLNLTGWMGKRECTCSPVSTKEIMISKIAVKTASLLARHPNSSCRWFLSYSTDTRPRSWICEGLPTLHPKFCSQCRSVQGHHRTDTELAKWNADFHLWL